MSTYRNARRDAAVADDYLEGHAQCMFCGGTTERETLSMFGARCGPCFQQYVTQGKRYGAMPNTEERRAVGQRLRAILSGRTWGKQWAYELRDREERGEQLTPAQRETWRIALRERANSEAA